MKFLGTGAGDGTPNPFCRCKICENARKVGGREIRMRSSFMLSDNVVIDIGADFFAQSLMYDTPFDSVQHVLYTHTHDDHLNYMLVWERFVRRSGEDKGFNIYLTEDAYSFLDRFYMTSPVTDGREVYIKGVNFVKLSFGKSYDIGGYSVTPLKGNHGTAFEKHSANFLCEKDGKTLYYALDSGYFLPETFAALKDKRLDTFIGECTFPVPENGIPATEKDWHMDFTLCLKNLDRLYEIGAIDNHTDIYLSHIASLGVNHEEFSKIAGELNKPYTVKIAYDNLNI